MFQTSVAAILMALHSQGGGSFIYVDRGLLDCVIAESSTYLQSRGNPILIALATCKSRKRGTRRQSRDFYPDLSTERQAGPVVLKLDTTITFTRSQLECLARRPRLAAGFVHPQNPTVYRIPVNFSCDR